MGTVDGRKRSSSSSPPEVPHFQLSLFNVVLMMTIFFLSSSSFPSSVYSLNYTHYREVSSLRMRRIQGHLDKINKPPVLTIEVQHVYIVILFVCIH